VARLEVLAAKEDCRRSAQSAELLLQLLRSRSSKRMVLYSGETVESATRHGVPPPVHDFPSCASAPGPWSDLYLPMAKHTGAAHEP
jgi:hypothetical protein